MITYILGLLALGLVSGQGLFHGRDNACHMKRKDGNCKAYFPSFYYDQEAKLCDCFVYTGCGGNKNRFEVMENCMQACGVTPNDQRITDSCRNVLSGMGILDILLERYENNRIPDIDIRLVPGRRPSNGSTKTDVPFSSTPSTVSTKNDPIPPSSLPPFDSPPRSERPFFSSLLPPYRPIKNNRPFSSRPLRGRESAEEERPQTSRRNFTDSTRDDRPLSPSIQSTGSTGDITPLSPLPDRGSTRDFPPFPPIEPTGNLPPLSPLPPPPPPPPVGLIKDIKPSSSVPSFFQSAKHQWQN